MSSNDGSSDFQKFLDTQQYNRKGILRYEKIFGDMYISTGGQDTTTKFAKELDLKVRITNEILDALLVQIRLHNP
jgi:phosphoethanolamine N-methyltransferase